jgi:hypothetical protein
LPDEGATIRVMNVKTATGAGPTGSSSLLPWLAVAAMAAVYMAAVPFTITHLDLARDIGAALDIAEGVRFALQGPVFDAGGFHFGPAWYYLLALPLWLTHSWLATVLVVGLLSAAKFPLAYAIGTRLVDRSFGLLWALLLLLPGWGTYETILVLHTSLVATCTLALLWLLLRYEEDARDAHLIGAALLLALALHAHPSTYGVVAAAALALAWRWVRAGHRFGPAAWAALAFVAPFLPYFAHQIRSGFPDFAPAASYLGAAGAFGKFTDLPRLFVGLFGTGPEAIARDFLGGWDAAPQVFAALYMVVGAMAFAGLAGWLVRGVRRALVGGSIALVLGVAASVVVVRSITPYYMTFVVTVLGSGLLALGLRASMDLPVLRRLVRPLAAMIGVAAMATTAGVAMTLSAGAYPFAFSPLFDVKQPYRAGLPLPFMPANALADSGDALCPRRQVTAHGSYAVHLLHDYALETRLRCKERPDLRLGGAAPAEAEHLVGVSSTVMAKVPLPSSQRIGPLALLPAVQTLNPVTGIAVPDHRAYPPIPLEYGPAQERVLRFDAGGDEAVLVTNLSFALAPDPQVSASVDGNDVPAAARDGLMTAFVCPACDPGARYRWTVNIRATAPDRIDVVTVRSAR